MKLIVFGSTGSIGSHVVEQALESGHEVTAFARNPAALDISHANLKLVSGDVFNKFDVNCAVENQDAVVVALGSAKLTGKLRSEGTENVITAMEDKGVARLVCLSTLGVGESNDNLDFFWKYLMFGMVLRFVFQDHVRQEEIVKNSNLNWTIVRPSAYTDEVLEGEYRHGFSSDEKDLKLKISRVEVASFMLEQLSNGKYMRQTPALSY